MKPPRLHMGLHYYAAGNLGDDLMVAGFLTALERRGIQPRPTCATPFDRSSQRIRFPQIEWVDYTAAERERCVAGCDAWVGVGASPFQGDFSTWFLDHLMEELALCQRHHKPMYFLGVGLNHRHDVSHPQTRKVLGAAEHVWTRDALSAELFADICGSGRVTAGADLSHLYLGDLHFGPVERGVLGLVLNFEDPAQFNPAALSQFIDRSAPWRLRWLVQEVRALPGSELEILSRLPERQRSALDVRVPAYAEGRLWELLNCWGVPELLVTSRYHALAIGAWMGSRLVPIERSDKLRGLTAPLRLEALPSFTSADEVLRSAEHAPPADELLLGKLASLAGKCCDEFFDEVQGGGFFRRALSWVRGGSRTPTTAGPESPPAGE